MMFSTLQGRRRVLLYDLAVAAWIALWIVVGLEVVDRAREISRLADSVATTGAAVTDSGRALSDLNLPLVDTPVEAAGNRIQEAGRSVEQSGRASRERIDRFARLLGLLVAVIPILPVLAFYLPPRLARTRETTALRRMLASGGASPALRELLARRAAQNLSYASLARVSAKPWEDLAEGRYEALAQAELRRAGLWRRLPAE